MRKEKVLIAAVTAIVVALVMYFAGPQRTEMPAKTTPSPVVIQSPVAPQYGFAKASTVVPANRPQTHRVRRGENLTEIADRYKIGVESMMLANERYLQGRYKTACDDLSRNFRNRRRDRGTSGGGLFYCNDRFRRPYGNTLQSGWRLAVPSGISSQSVSEAVSRIRGNRIALVIDDSGSMTNDRERVAQFYLAALRQYGKRLTHVWLYADGKVRRYEGGNVEFLTSGTYENTYGALTAAAQEHPDAIVLVTDEPGDDWNWQGATGLPPVVGHCLADQGRTECAGTLRQLARVTQGQYLTGLQ